VTLFRGLSGADWGTFATPLHAAGEVWGGVWVLYIFIGIFGLVSLNTAVIVNVIRQPLPQDQAMRIANDLQEERALEHMLEAEARRCGQDSTIMYARTRFTRFVQSTHVAHRLRHFGIDIARWDDVFDLIVRDAARRFLALRGGAKSVDMTRLQDDVRWIKTLASSLARATHETRYLVGRTCQTSIH